jgi:ribosomal-protein-alanine N-acetyltransferase
VVRLSPLEDQVRTPRLRLELITRADADAMLAGRRKPGWHPEFPRQDDLDGVSMIREESCWGSRRIVRALDGLVVGTIGFFGPPAPAEDGLPEVEIGYGLVTEARGRGVATEALRALLAQTDAAGIRVRASVEPENAPSIRVLAKCGFTVLRGSDEDGNLVMVRPLSPT